MKCKKFAPLPLLILISAIILLTNGCTHRLQDGMYKGIEAITVSPDKQYWPGVFKEWINTNDSLSPKWFHDVRIAVKDGKATVAKRPFYIKNGTKWFSDSTGGFYYYGADVDYDKKDRRTTLLCHLDSCNFCPKTATATPLYVYESYEIRQQKNKLAVNTDTETGLVFTRQ